MKQTVIRADGEYGKLNSWFAKARSVMLVCGKSIEKQKIYDYLLNLPKGNDLKISRFSDFTPNPDYESVVRGVRIFREQKCDAIVAIGGGSAIDVAKCIKLYANMANDGEEGLFLKTPVIPNDIPFLAVPTTAGTGSEATRFAVIYYKGNKQSIADDSCIPDCVLFDVSTLKTLPLYHKKATMLDAFCHAIESFWSVNSTDESKSYSRKAIQEILKASEAYLDNTDEGNSKMLKAANLAGKAINITQTTAGHAMCYKITSLFGCAHGHAAGLCVRALYKWMTDNPDKCTDKRGQDYLKHTLDEIGLALGCPDAKSGAEFFSAFFDSLGLSVPCATELQFEELKTSVNPVRLKNHPIALSENDIDTLYKRILKENKS